MVKGHRIFSAAYDSRDPEAVVKLHGPDAILPGTANPVISVGPEGSDNISRSIDPRSARTANPVQTTRFSGHKRGFSEELLTRDSLYIRGFYSLTRPGTNWIEHLAAGEG